VYGFGENTHSSFQHKFSYSNWWAMFGRDQPTGGKGKFEKYLDLILDFRIIK
jgi:hypothetical protein